MSKNEIQTESYNCITAGKVVLITREYFRLNDFRELVGFDCNSWKECGVGKEERPGNWIPTWAKCEHPQSHK
jgi:hypothetical protein